MSELTPAQTERLLKKIEGEESLTEKDLKNLRGLVEALAVTVRTQDEQLRYFESVVAILRDGNAASLALTTSAVSALKIVAPPTASIDGTAVRKQVDQFRKEIKDSTQKSQTVATVAKFAVNLVGKFV